MNQGTKEQAIELAQQRWAQLHPFDLAPETWQDIFANHMPGDVLQAIRKTARTRDKRPEVLHRSLLHWLELFEQDRRDAVTWPPPDVSRN